MDELRSCYDAITREAGKPAESLRVASAVERLRQFWRPRHVRVLLLAESHVLTTDDELAVHVQADGLPLAYPREFVRFVYCLGYGEPGILSTAISGNQGTRQFWKLFYSCCYPSSEASGFGKFLVSRSPLQDRVAAKLALLALMKERGIWLVDASITAIYRPGGGRLKPRDVARTLVASWDSYVERVVREADPAHVIVVGRGVEAILGSRLRSALDSRFTVIPQPQAQLVAAERLSIDEVCFSTCRQYSNGA